MVETVIEDKASASKSVLADHEAHVLAFDRRRAGRQQVSPVLVPLLRDHVAHRTPALDDLASTKTPYRDYLDTDPFHDPLAPARGIALGLSISMLFWGVVGYVIFR